MFITRRSALASALGGLLPLSALQEALAAAPTDYPKGPVTVLAPFAAGGTVDIVARTLGQRLSRELGQNFLVENRGGAGGSIAAGLLARAAPDGQTLMLTHQGLAFNATLYDKLPFDTARDILPVAHVGTTPNVLVVSNDLPVNSVAEFLALARAKPGAINYGSGGIGSAGHLPMEILQSAAGIKLQHVPYKGAGPAMVDLISGQIQAMLQTIPAVMSQIQAGKMRAIATSGKRRSPALPKIPTLDEAGIKGFDYAPWYGYFAPRGTPAAVLDRLHDAINTALADPEIAAKLGQQGLELQSMRREQFAGIVSADIVTWGKTITALNIKGE